MECVCGHAAFRIIARSEQRLQIMTLETVLSKSL